MNRARAFGITVRLTEDGRLVRVGFDFDYLWPKSRTQQVKWQMDLNGTLTRAIHEVIRQTARGLETSEAEAELYLLRQCQGPHRTKGGDGMLVLTRKAAEKILIGPGIVVQVVEIRGDKVRLGISAPDDVLVHRDEVWLRIVAEQQLAVHEDVHEEVAA